MSHVLTLVADRTATTLSAAIIARVREAIQRRPAGAARRPARPPTSPCAAPPDPAAVAAALDGAAVDAIATKARGRRKGLLVADMDSTIVTTRDAGRDSPPSPG